MQPVFRPPVESSPAAIPPQAYGSASRVNGGTLAEEVRGPAFLHKPFQQEEMQAQVRGMLSRVASAA